MVTSALASAGRTLGCGDVLTESKVLQTQNRMMKRGRNWRHRGTQNMPQEVPASPLPGCVTLAESLDFSELPGL